MKIGFGIALFFALSCASCHPVSSGGAAKISNAKCVDFNPEYNLYWGDLHVHTAYSMDAYAFGTTSKPSDAFAFAKGQPTQYLSDTDPVTLNRPLDFAAVTDHAETFGVMHICTEAHHQNNSEYCQKLRSLSGTDPEKSQEMFRDFLLPVIAGETPKPSILCAQKGIDCDAAALRQWGNIQSFANEADTPCDFSAFIGYEWSATPGSAHWHRNLIFKGKSVTKGLVDYVTYPTPEQMWAELETQCRPEEQCDVLAIPHNTNLSEGGGFDVENAAGIDIRRRAKYERLIEITQSKGTSECLNENWDDYGSDCGFETFLLPKTKAALAGDPSRRVDFNQSFTRNILSRGLQYYRENDGDINPLQLGIIGSTDNHTATPGLVEEAFWRGDAWGGGDQFRPRWLARGDYNPGGLVAVWSPQNTRGDVFGALKSRRAYATSGTRIFMRFSSLKNDASSLSCEDQVKNGSPMGSTIKQFVSDKPKFVIQARQDIAPLARVQIVKGTLKSGKISEQVIAVRIQDEGFSNACETWADPDFDPKEPAYWYVRVEEVETPRWSKMVCEDLERCADFPKEDRMIRERAWSSPIWYLPNFDPVRQKE